MENEQSLHQFVRGKIRAIFSEVAELYGEGEIGADDGEDESAGVPAEIFHAEQALIRAWDKYVQKGR